MVGLASKFSFLRRKTAFCAPLNAYQTDVWFVRYTRVRSLSFLRDGINRMGPLLPGYTILRRIENMPQCLRKFLGNFNVGASQNYCYGFRNATNVRDNHKTNSRYLVHRSVTRISVPVCNSYEGTFLASYCPLRHWTHIYAPFPSNRRRIEDTQPSWARFWLRTFFWRIG